MGERRQMRGQPKTDHQRIQPAVPASILRRKLLLTDKLMVDASLTTNPAGGIRQTDACAAQANETPILRQRLGSRRGAVLQHSHH